MGDHIFICYARADESFVLTLAGQLKSRGVPVWLDRWDIPVEANWQWSIDKAIQDCAKFLIPEHCLLSAVLTFAFGKWRSNKIQNH